MKLDFMVDTTGVLDCVRLHKLTQYSEHYRSSKNCVHNLPHVLHIVSSVSFCVLKAFRTNLQKKKR